MIDPSIIEEAYLELNEVQIKEETKATEIVTPEDIEDNKDPVFERMKKLIYDIQSMLTKLDDSDDDKYGKEDDDIRNEMKTFMKTSIIKMIKRFEEITTKEWGAEEKEIEEEEEEKKEDDEDEAGSEEVEVDETKDANKIDDEPEVLKLFPTESIVSPQGISYTIIETNENKSLLQDPNGETFKIENDVLRNWKSTN